MSIPFINDINVVNGNLTINGSSSYAEGVNSTSAQAWKLLTDSSGNGIITANTTAAVTVIRLGASGDNYINSSLGVGTTSSTGARLTVVSGGTDPQILVKNSAGNSAEILFEDNDGGTQNAKITFSQGDQNTLTIATGYNSPTDLNRINIAPAGNVALTAISGSTGAAATLIGIGTTTPLAKLNVQTGTTIGWSNLANANILTGNTTTGIGIDTNEIASRGGALYIGTIDSGDDVYFRAGGATARMIIDGSNGNIAIGDTPDTSRLLVISNVAAAGGIARIRQTVASNSPTLFVEHTSAGGNANENTGLLIKSAGNGGGTQNIFHAYQENGSNTAMVIKGNSSVGIGMDLPTTKLTIEGSHSGVTAARMNIYHPGSQADRNAYLDMWASEPGVTYNGSGIGSNINGTPYYGRKTTSLGMSYIRFVDGVFLINTGPASASSGTTDITNARFTAGTGGDIKFNSYSGTNKIGTPTYILGTDNNGTIVKVLGGDIPGVSGQFLPLAGGTMTGGILFNNNVAETWKDNAGATTRMMVLNSVNAAYIGPIDTYAGGPIFYGASADVTAQVFYTGGSERIRVNASGNVGINNNNPSKKLEISSPTSSDGILLTGDGTGGGMSSGSYRGIGFSYTDTDTSYGSEIKFEVKDSASHGGQISFWTDATTGSGSPVRAMTIAPTQNVGIGTATPIQKLDTPNIIIGGSTIAGVYRANATLMDNLSGTARFYALGSNTSTAGGYQFNCLSSNASAGPGTVMTIFNTGNVGIATTVNVNKLDVGGVINIQGGNGANLTFNNGDANITVTNNNVDVVGRDMSFKTFKSGVGNTEKMRITRDGYVGIGNTTPLAKLDVYGVADDDRIARFESPDDGAYIQIRDNDTLGQLTVKDGVMAMGLGGVYPGSTMLNINASGNVGIGTASPQTNTKLDVNGAMRQDGKTSWLNSSGDPLTTTGRVVAGLLGNSAGNGSSALYMFHCYGGQGYQRIVYHCNNSGGTWDIDKDIDEGANAFDITASTPSSGSAVAFTFKGRTQAQSFSAAVWIEHIGFSLDTQYVG